MTPWTREEIEAWVRLEDERSRGELSRYVDGALYEAWASAFRAAREQLVARAPECPDYAELMARLAEVAGRPSSPFDSPPTPESQRALVDDALAALWAASLSAGEGHGLA